jgi:hypothetical protein
MEVFIMEEKKAKIEEIKQQIELLGFELALMKKSCSHEEKKREEDYAFCNICGEKLGWWGLYIT